MFRNRYRVLVARPEISKKFTVKIVTQLAVFIGNNPGNPAAVCEVLAKEGISIPPGSARVVKKSKNGVPAA